jgi:hypothetical protein
VDNSPVWTVGDRDTPSHDDRQGAIPTSDVVEATEPQPAPPPRATSSPRTAGWCRSWSPQRPTRTSSAACVPNAEAGHPLPYWQVEPTGGGPGRPGSRRLRAGIGIDAPLRAVRPDLSPSDTEERQRGRYRMTVGHKIGHSLRPTVASPRPDTLPCSTEPPNTGRRPAPQRWLCVGEIGPPGLPAGMGGEEVPSCEGGTSVRGSKPAKEPLTSTVRPAHVAAAWSGSVPSRCFSASSAMPRDSPRAWPCGHLNACASDHPHLDRAWSAAAPTSARAPLRLGPAAHPGVGLRPPRPGDPGDCVGS